MVSNLVGSVKKAARLNSRLTKKLEMITRGFGVPIHIPHIIPRRLDMLAFGYLGEEALLFHWGVSKLVNRYREALGSRPKILTHEVK